MARLILAILVISIVFSTNCARCAPIPVPNFEGTVSLLKTPGEEILPSVSQGAEGLKKLLENREDFPYPVRVVLYAPGYLGSQSNIKYVLSFLLPAWEAWQAQHSKSTLVVCSRFPPWCQVFPPPEVQSLKDDYQRALSPSILRGDFFTALSHLLKLIEEDIKSRDASVKIKIEATRVKNAREKQERESLGEALAWQLRLSLEYLGERYSSLEALVGSAPCCEAEVREARSLLRGLTPEDLGIAPTNPFWALQSLTARSYAFAARLHQMEERIQAALEEEENERLTSFLWTLGLGFFLWLGVFLWAGFSRSLRDTLRKKIEKLDREIRELGSELGDYRGKTRLNLGGLLTELGVLLQHSMGAGSNYLLFGLDRKRFVFPVYLRVIWRQAKTIELRQKALLREWRPTLSRVEELLRLPIRDAVSLLGLRAQSVDTDYQTTLSKYESWFGEKLARHLSSLRKVDPDSFHEELALAHKRQRELEVKFGQLAELLRLPDWQAKRASARLKIVRARADLQDPIDRILEIMRKHLL